MAWESPLDPPNTSKSRFIDGCEWVYLIIFTFELGTKVLAYGFVLHKEAYLHDPWCQLDFVVVTLAWCAAGRSYSVRRGKERREGAS